MRLSIFAAAALACTGLVFAQAKPATTTAPAKAEKPAAVKVVTPEALKVHGTIVSVDLVANSVVVKAEKVEDTISVNAGTKVKIGGKAGTLGDLKATMAVTVHYQQEAGKKIATEINEKVKEAVAPKKEEKAAAATPAK